METKRMELKESGVVFNEELHQYLLDGKELSGITGMIQRQLFPDEFEGVPEEMMMAAAEYGTDVHASIEDFDKHWINDGTQEVADYIEICKEHGLVHECSEYCVTDSKNWASMIDKVYRVDDTTFDIGDIKTYGTMTSDKLEKARWQLSIYAYLFEFQNRKAKVGRLFIIHLRNKPKKDGTFDHIKDVIFVNRIPSDVCKELMDCDLRGEQFNNPYSIPENIRNQESEIRELIQTKNEVEEKLSVLKSNILSEMELLDVRSWFTDTMRLTRKLPGIRTSFDLQAFKKDHPDIDFESYMKTSKVAGALVISI
ncbi:PD-(D/E)XK nuclease family protein [Phocaeicola coprocola]|jgi:hypothetical protein|uniref:Uncharacterized protein n=2 Tax=Phocaeicola coprocola TaxID=310298 RepID=B3JNN4_9BACT|nr:PD-(D/E)XK nuclease family protein [Phocaeicola coprocola]EDU99449.1 hypothetical protein BACCOP_03548 [Phocaeicola coprocola DSM 17136]MCC3348688.1 PD-(D/E)XK nuclease family protein [Phocaeicola coprocola DSM 17136]RGR89730.1 hypothetical protein DWY20_14005 [Phocaeicola coprocola]